jgi:hypothetical protein
MSPSLHKAMQGNRDKGKRKANVCGRKKIKNILGLYDEEIGHKNNENESV